jgi:hypothetical protein
MSKVGTIIQLRGGHTSFVPDRAPHDIVSEISGLRDFTEFFYLEDPQREPGNGPRMAFRPSEVVALVQVGDFERIAKPNMTVVLKEKCSALKRARMAY